MFIFSWLETEVSKYIYQHVTNLQRKDAGRKEKSENLFSFSALNGDLCLCPFDQLHFARAKILLKYGIARNQSLFNKTFRGKKLSI